MALDLPPDKPDLPPIFLRFFLFNVLQSNQQSAGNPWRDLCYKTTIFHPIILLDPDLTWIARWPHQRKLQAPLNSPGGRADLSFFLNIPMRIFFLGGVWRWTGLIEDEKARLKTPKVCSICAQTYFDLVAAPQKEALRIWKSNDQRIQKGTIALVKSGQILQCITWI